MSLANAKTHNPTCITSALKNQFSRLPEKKKKRHYRSIDSIVLEITRVVPLRFLYLLYGLAYWLCWREKKRKLGILRCGRDPVVVYTSIAKVVGFTPFKIKYITMTAKYDLVSLTLLVKGKDLCSAIVTLLKERALFSSRKLPPSQYNAFSVETLFLY